MPSFSLNFAPVAAKQIAAVEKALGIKFPSEYKKFLRTINGGVPAPNCFTVPDRGDALCDFLYGICEKRTHGDLEKEQNQVTQLDPLPPGFLVIGHDPGGSRLLLATIGKDAGQVFFWDRNGFWIRKDGNNTFPITKGFAKFLADLHEMPSDE